MHLLPSALARGNVNRDLFSGIYVCTYVEICACVDLRVVAIF